METKILFLLPYPLAQSPSQRFRFEQYFQILRLNRISFQTQSFLNKDEWKIFYSPGNSIKKFVALLAGFLKRFAILFTLRRFDFVFIHREVTPVGPPFFEWLIARVFKKKIIYDFDDAIWLTDRKQEGIALRILKWRNKVSSICKWSYRVSCGNEYLCEYAREYNKAVTRIPTTIDTVGLHNPDLFKKESGGEIIIGWTGSHSTMKYLKDLENVLCRLQEKYPNVLVWVISDRIPNLQIPRLSYKQWSLNSEIKNLAQFDVGIMPLPDDQWAKGKCGFKALQYLALRIPCVVSPVGINTEIVIPGKEGFHAKTEDEWIEKLSILIEDHKLRNQMGNNGRKKVEAYYSVVSNTDFFLSLFEKFEIKTNPKR
jgi:glycosyltransferase involved in cell wall biosynthesis